MERNCACDSNEDWTKKPLIMVLQNTAVTIRQNSCETGSDGETEAVIQRCTAKNLSWESRKIHKKAPVSESLLNIVPAIQSATLLKKRLRHSSFM